MGVHVGRGVTLGRGDNSRLISKFAVCVQPVDAPSMVRTYTQSAKPESYPSNSRSVPAGRVWRTFHQVSAPGRNSVPLDDTTASAWGWGDGGVVGSGVTVAVGEGEGVGV